MMSVMTLPANLDQLTADELRELVLSQAAVITRNDQELNWRQAKIDKLTHEVAYYKRHYFGVKAERLPVEQGQLFEETLAADMAAMTEELAQLSETEAQGASEAQTLAAGAAAHRDSPRTGIDHLRLRLPAEAHR
jgi:transposase